MADDQSERVQRMNSVHCLPLLLLHAGCFALPLVGFSWTASGVALALYWLRMFAITGFYHRYFSHRAFQTSRLMQFIIAVWGNTAVQRGPLWWASHHRQHHAHSDRPPDAHSPVQYGFTWAHMGWLTASDNLVTNKRFVRDLARYPELRFLDRFELLVPVLFAGALFGAGELLRVGIPGLGTSGWQMLVWGFFVSTVVLFHGTCLINSLAHRMGTRRYDTPDDSRNSLLLALVTMGEGWHNNHHRYPSAARQGFYWWEIDITYYLLRGMERLGLIWDLRPVPAKVLHRHGDSASPGVAGVDLRVPAVAPER
ncbi:MAG: acyl-CoA desaturase [Phycisphaerales bacterium]|nr:acyl-CoA desaturase [Phycisphaerales bacterium]